MARVGTAVLNLGMWLDADNPGAGSQSVDNTGLNGDKIKLETAIATEHNANGTHKDDKIDGPALKTTVADGSSIEATGTPRKLQLKALGIQKGHINSNVADADSLQKNGTSGALEIKAVKAGKILGTGTGKAVDGATIGLNASNELEVKDAGITLAKLDATLKDSQSYLVYSQRAEAAAEAGSFVSAYPTWSESSAMEVVKMITSFRKRSIDKYLKLVCRARVSGGATWRASCYAYQLLGGGGGVNGATTGTNSSYSVTTEDVVITVDISSLTNDRIHNVELRMNVSAGAGVMDATGLVISVHGG